MNLTETEWDIVGEALIRLLVVKKEAMALIKGHGDFPKFTPSDFAIPQIESIIARIEAM